MNIDKERRFIELLGYSVVGPDGSNRWKIIDDNQNDVGYIQYKKLENGSKKKGYVRSFGYQTHIDSPNISYDFSRRLNDKYGNIIDEDGAFYSFALKRDNKKIAYVDMSIGTCPSLNIWSKEYGYVEFRIENKTIYLDFKSKINNFNIEEFLNYSDRGSVAPNAKQYIYQIAYTHKDNKSSGYNPNEGRTTLEIAFTQPYDRHQPYNCHDDKVKISKMVWADGGLKDNDESILEGTIEQMAGQFNIGKGCISRFRNFINQIIPFNEDIFSVMDIENVVKEKGLEMYFPNFENKEEKVNTKILLPNKKNN